ncbi:MULTISPECIES: hypothetical protein [Frankia]|uniref:Uncharacterized protein n=1 Tax=Frankia alni (strain DSM 45986 / CECT 9034 / ACN14a) TaxID=326424 RepID=Q0RM20_FRAAA|nr:MULTISPECIES: hypothetical protein [Frankia]CAJ61432.1 hypothetical protein FRAAL2788 [Frankia alni ACN14a]
MVYVTSSPKLPAPGVAAVSPAGQRVVILREGEVVTPAFAAYLEDLLRSTCTAGLPSQPGRPPAHRLRLPMRCLGRPLVVILLAVITAAHLALTATNPARLLPDAADGLHRSGARAAVTITAPPTT